MYLWNYKALTKDFIENKITEREKFTYFMFSSLLLMVGMGASLSILQTTGITNADILDYWAYTILFVVGTILIYKKNKEGDGKNFVERYICLSVPTFIRAYVLGFFLSMLYIAFSPTATLDSETLTLGEHIVWFLATAVGYYLLYASIEEVSQAKKQI